VFNLRDDDAFISIKIVPEARPLLEKYIGKLQNTYSTYVPLRIDGRVDKIEKVMAVRLTESNNKRRPDQVNVGMQPAEHQANGCRKDDRVDHDHNFGFLISHIAKPLMVARADAEQLFRCPFQAYHLLFFTPIFPSNDFNRRCREIATYVYRLLCLFNFSCVVRIDFLHLPVDHFL
jgi:hypothetical protein